MMRVRLQLFSSEESGRIKPIIKGFRCVSVADRHPVSPFQGWDVMPLLESPMHPGESRELDMLFLTDEGKQTMQKTGTFHLWDGRIFGTATIIHGPTE
jgi:hypothetical protein